MALVETAKLDSKGRVLIPQHLREAARIMANDRVIVSFDEEKRRITIEPAKEKRLLRLAIVLSDKPGALAAAASALAMLKVDLVSTYSHSSSRGESAVWVVECNPSSNSENEIRDALLERGAKLVSAKWI